jgi:hypothetical protein
MKIPPSNITNRALERIAGFFSGYPTSNKMFKRIKQPKIKESPIFQREGFLLSNHRIK